MRVRVVRTWQGLLGCCHRPIQGPVVCGAQSADLHDIIALFQRLFWSCLGCHTFVMDVSCHNQYTAAAEPHRRPAILGTLC